MRRVLFALLTLASCSPAPTAQHAALNLGDPREHHEVFWSFALDGPNWHGMAEQGYGIQITANGVDEPRIEDAEVSRTATGALAVATGARLELTYAACTNDGVSYPFRARLVQGARTLTGCAFSGPSVQALALTPWLDACIAASPRTRRETLMQVEADGTVLVRLTDQHGGPAVDCRIPLNAAPQIRPRDAALRLAGENEYVLVRPPYEETSCGAALPNEDGSQYGWMEYPAENCASATP